MQLLIGAYAKALEIIPRQLCDNAGFDATNILNKLRAKHAQVGFKQHSQITLHTFGYICDPDRLKNSITAGWHVVRCGHQQRRHCRQLCQLCLGAFCSPNQCPDSSVRGSLPHPLSR